MFLFECLLKFPYHLRRLPEKVYVIAESPDDAKLLITKGQYKSIDIKMLCEQKNILSSDNKNSDDDKPITNRFLRYTD